MPKILIISDIHNRHEKVQKLLNTIEYDKCIFLGDFWDQFGDFPEDVRQTALWLKSAMQDDRHVFLFGNHCIAYIFAYNQRTRCSGYTEAKRQAIFSVLNYDDIIERFKWFHVEAGFLFTHAGITRRVWEEIQLMEPEGAQLLDVLPKWVDRSFNGVRTMTPAPLFEAGWSRGGSQQHGGILWADWSEFSPIAGVNQIVGHSPHEVPEVMIKRSGDGMVRRYNAHEWVWGQSAVNKQTLSSINYALDTHSRHFAIITDGVVELWDWDLMLPMKDGNVITTTTGGMFVPHKQLNQPDFGVFRLNHASGKVEEITGKELCDASGMYTPSSNNVTMLLASLLKNGCKVQFIRRNKKVKGQSDPDNLDVDMFSAAGEEPPDWWQNQHN